MSSAPIGIFDSGVGGLTVARAVLDQLPDEGVLYLGDTARAPYGPRPLAQVRAYALECLDALVEAGVKLLVIACNSASAAVLHDARERYPVPVVEVIRPAVRRAAASTRNGRIGVVCTAATAVSGAYADAFAAAPDIRVTTAACPRFVEFVEAGRTSGAELLDVAADYLAPVVAAGVDTLVLGCTHYPLMTGVLSYVMGEGVVLVSSAEETAQTVYRELVSRGAQRQPAGAGSGRRTGRHAGQLPPPEHRWLTTGDPARFAELARRFLGGAAPEALHAERHTTELTTASLPVVRPLAAGRPARVG